MNKKLTVTIGIPVYNEERNISFLLRSILNQQKITYKLDKVIVLSDGSTDDTQKEVIKIAKEFPFVLLIADKQRKGKKHRLMELYRLNSSDFIFTFDGDIVLKESNVIENMLRCFDNNDVVLAGANILPLESKTLVGKLVNTWSKVWFEARKGENKGNNVNNIRGCALALRKNFAKTIRFKKEILSDAQFLYFWAAKNNLQFKFANDATILYRKPDNIADLLFQTKRTKSDRSKLAKLFGNSVHKHYEISLLSKIKAVFKIIIHDSIFTPLAAIFFLLITIYPKRRQAKFGIWKPSQSTKRAINLKKV